MYFVSTYYFDYNWTRWRKECVEVDKTCDVKFRKMSRQFHSSYVVVLNVTNSVLLIKEL